MKIILESDGRILKEIELSTLQLKAIQLNGQEPENYISHKIERILDFTISQAKQIVDRISPLTEVEIEGILDKIEVEKAKLEAEYDNSE